MNAARLIASFLGSGFAPKAPGTVGSALAALLGAALLQTSSVWPLVTGIILVCPLGLWAADRAGGGEDHGWIVIDEVAGMWITMLGLGLHPDGRLDIGFIAWVLVAFALFRLFDISKPGPVGWLDRRHDALGIMGDDIVAGFLAAIVLAGLRLMVDWI